jgi:hypothetical protein
MSSTHWIHLSTNRQDITGELGEPTALDVGCMTGALTFCMASRCGRRQNACMHACILE